ncbi:hypothetical protein WUBG_14349 [Wuchereria bancrofti]|uniref:Uncharacterized protein n=1 Tax=Wuchereria bancrofti TaxID=6293 RepID=J9DYC9_WUCBA|nr:hypothetical protein WUBG_14349 [Wuchereria bancrofti]
MNIEVKFIDKEEILSSDQNVSKIDPLNVQEESKSISKMDELSAESSVEFLEEEVPMKSQKLNQSHKKGMKTDLKLKSHRGEPIKESDSFETDKQMISARNKSASRSASDTSVHYPKMKRKTKKKKKTKTRSTLERELSSEQPPSLSMIKI